MLGSIANITLSALLSFDELENGNARSGIGDGCAQDRD
jgi:hypothetical protein